jgi:hypothetical protein
MADENKLKELLRFQINRQITNLYKQFLIILEDYPNDYPSLSDAYTKARKRVLDAGNGSIREIEELLENLDISLKN